MQDSRSRQAVSGELDRELRSTLAALEELGPAYEPELAVALGERLRRLQPPAPPFRRRERPVGGTGLPLIAALAVAGALLLSGVAHTHSAAWRYGFHRDTRVAPFNGGFMPAQPAPPAPSLPPPTF